MTDATWTSRRTGGQLGGVRIGVVGSGEVGAALARLWAAAGHEVHRDPGASPADVARVGEVVLLDAPWPEVPALLAAAGDLAGRVVVDTTHPPASPSRVAPLAAGAAVVKAFTTLSAATLAAATRPGPAVPLSGDDPRAVALVAALVDDAGLTPVPIGGLAGAARQEPGGPLDDQELTVAQVHDRLRELERRNLALARRFVEEVLGAGDGAALAELVDPDVVVNSGISPLAPMVGRDAFATGLGALAAFTFQDFVLEDLLAVEDRVVARYRAHADHTGDQLGVPATHRNVTMWEIRLMRWRAGRLVEDFVADINYDWPWLVAPAYPDGVGRTGRS